MFIYEIMNYIFLKLERHFLTMILSHLSDFLQKKKKNVCTKFFLSHFPVFPCFETCIY